MKSNMAEPDKKKSPAPQKKSRPGSKTGAKEKAKAKKKFLADGNQGNFEDSKEREPVRNSDAVGKSGKQDPKTRWSEKTMSLSAYSVGREFSVHRKWAPLVYTILAWEKNEEKNRYDDIRCVDSTRVKLKDRSADDDYIHASWMELPDNQKYICTQGPVTCTLEDFWHMIYTEKSRVIVMLTALEDDEAFSKCTRYFPLGQETFTAGPYKITIKSEEKEPFAGMKHTILLLEKDDGGRKMDVHHMVYDTWTDHFSPETAGPTVGLIKLCRKLAGGEPITVHCSAGIGRTCTFVGIDYASLKISKSKDDKFEMLDVLKELRKMRYHAIQTPLQYVFMHLGVLEMFVQDGTIKREAPFEKFQASYQTALKKAADKAKKKQE